MRKRKMRLYSIFPNFLLPMTPFFPILLMVLVGWLPTAAFAQADDSGEKGTSAESNEGDEAEPIAPPAPRQFRLRSKGEAPVFSPKEHEKGPVATDPGRSDGRTGVGAGAGAGMILGRVEDAASLPPELSALAKEGALAVAEGDWKKARAAYLELVKAAPDNALAYANLGVVEHQLGNLLAASGNLRRSTELSPRIARNWQTLGLIHYERGELALAISCLTRALHEDPESAEARLVLAAVVRDYGWTDAAVTELQRAVELNPKLGAAHYNLAVTYLETDPPRIELARRHYYAAIDLGSAASPEIEAIFETPK